MARKNINKSQLELPFIEPPKDPESSEGAEIADGVSVTLEERAAALARAAEMYATYNKLTIGLGKAAVIPEELVKLNDRYGADRVPGVVAGAKVNSFYGPSQSEIDIDHPSGEMQVLEGLLKTRELLASGDFSKGDIEADLQPMIVGIRHAIGTTKHGVKAAERNAEIKKVRATARRAQHYAK